MPFEWTVKINNPRALDMKARIRQGFLLAGQAWEGEMRRYPPAPPNVGLQGTHERTNNLAKQVKHAIPNPTELDFIAPKVATYLLIGTGIYGPKGAMITPKSAPFLRWRVTDRSHPLAGQLVKALAVRGTIWQGKLEAVKKGVMEAFRRGIRET